MRYNILFRIARHCRLDIIPEWIHPAKQVDRKKQLTDGIISSHLGLRVDYVYGNFLFFQ